MPIISDSKKGVGMVATYSGRLVDVRAPRAADICLIDVAMHLADEMRWGGAAYPGYCVADHSVEVSRRVARWGSPSLELAALFHDGHEGYGLRDVPAPVKLLPGVADALAPYADLLDAAIADHFGFDAALMKDPRVVAADREVAAEEARQFVRNSGRWCSGTGGTLVPSRSREVAALRFVERYAELAGL